MAYNDIREKYRKLYVRLKSEGIDALKRIRAPLETHREIVQLIRELPHPDLSSIWDIEYVCRLCTSGKLEGLYQFFGEEAKELASEIRTLFPEERTSEEVPVPPSAEAAEIGDVARMLAWTNETLLKSHSLLYTINTKTLKSQCPYCYGDLVEAVVGNELRLICKAQPKPECKKYYWIIGGAAQRP
jgi:hypothetical protein